MPCHGPCREKRAESKGGEESSSKKAGTGSRAPTNSGDINVQGKGRENVDSALKERLGHTISHRTLNMSLPQDVLGA